MCLIIIYKMMYLFAGVKDMDMYVHVHTRTEIYGMCTYIYMYTLQCHAHTHAQTHVSRFSALKPSPFIVLSE